MKNIVTEKECPKCKTSKPFSEFRKWNKVCKDCVSKKWSNYHQQYREEHKTKINAYAKIYRESNKDKIKEYMQGYLPKREAHLKHKYGITQEDFDVMYIEQDGKCLICGEEKLLHVDHNHDTGKVRGLLCKNCNTALGLYKENLETIKRAALYLESQNA